MEQLIELGGTPKELLVMADAERLCPEAALHTMRERRLGFRIMDRAFLKGHPSFF